MSVNHPRYAASVFVTDDTTDGRSPKRLVRSYWEIPAKDSLWMDLSDGFVGADVRLAAPDDSLPRSLKATASVVQEGDHRRVRPVTVDARRVPCSDRGEVNLALLLPLNRRGRH